MENRKSEIVLQQNDVFDKLYCVNTLVNMIKTSCINHEFKGQYYGISSKNLKKLSDERNEYITMLDLISDKLSDIQELNLCIEKNLTLQKDTNDCC